MKKYILIFVILSVAMFASSQDKVLKGFAVGKSRTLIDTTEIKSLNGVSGNLIEQINGKVDTTDIVDVALYTVPEVDALLNKIRSSDITDDYTLQLTDAGKTLIVNVATAKTVTIPLNAAVAFPVNTIINVITIGAGDVSIAITATGTLLSENSMVKIGSQYSGVSLIKTDTDTWIILGRLKA